MAALRDLYGHFEAGAVSFASMADAASAKTGTMSAAKNEVRKTAREHFARGPIDQSWPGSTLISCILRCTMSRPLRLEFSGALYHIVARGNERREVFREDRDRELYLARVAHYRDKFGFRFYAYCLMGNHLHLVLETGKTPLSRIMLGIQGSYTQVFNRRHDRVGHLFQGRYKAFLVQKDSYLLALIRYVHENPVVAGLVQRVQDYPWSSDRFYRRGRGPEWMDVDDGLRIFASKRSVAVHEYRRFSARRSGRYEEAQRFGQIVRGDEDFAHWAFELAGEPDLIVRNLDAARVAGAVARHLDLDVNALRAPARGRQESEARGLAAYLGRELARIPISRTAEYFRRDGSTLVRDVQRLEERIAKDPEVRRKAAVIRKILERRNTRNQR